MTNRPTSNTNSSKEKVGVLEDYKWFWLSCCYVMKITTDEPCHLAVRISPQSLMGREK